MNTLYFECYSGISGDMAAGALIDLGVDREFLLNQLHTVPLEQFEIDISKTDKQGISAVAFDIHTNHSTVSILMNTSMHIPILITTIQAVVLLKLNISLTHLKFQTKPKKQRKKYFMYWRRQKVLFMECLHIKSTFRK